jgi:PAS domain S-box-containing protein
VNAPPPPPLPSPLPRWRSVGSFLASVLVAALAYGGSALLAVNLPGVQTIGSSVWPASGIAIAALLLGGKRLWIAIPLGVQLFDWLDPSPTYWILGILGMGGAVLQALAAHWLLGRVGFDRHFRRASDALKFLLVAALGATQISCTLGTLALVLQGLIPAADYWPVRSSWWLGDTMGVLIFAPLILQAAAARRSDATMLRSLWPRDRPRRFALGVLLGLAIASTVAVFLSRVNADMGEYPIEYLPVLFVLWIAIQFDRRLAVLTSFLVAVIAIGGSSQGRGPFFAPKKVVIDGQVQIIEQVLTQGEETQGEARILQLQAFLGVTTSTALLLSSALGEQREATRSLRHNERKYRELVENANSIIIKLDREGKIIFFNEFAQNFFGYAESEILGQSPMGTIIPMIESTGRDLNAFFSHLLERPEQFSCAENENQRRNGDRVWVTWSNKPIFDESGQFEGILCIGTDTTEQRRISQELKLLNEQLETRVAERTQALQQQQEKAEYLLLNILPKPIADRLSQDVFPIADLFDDVTVLFADIVDFTTFAAARSPLEVVERLNGIFSCFDRLAEVYGLEKIKTIGDAYMAVGGLPVPREDHAAAVADMALAMQRAIGDYRKPDGSPFQVRIGIHAGSAVAGTIGLKKFIYDLWGDTVNVASRMESTGQANAIQVSEEVYGRLRDRYHLELRGKISVKGRGTMTTYWLLGKYDDEFLENSRLNGPSPTITREAISPSSGLFS